MKKIEVRPDGSRRVYTENLEPSMTDQQWKDDCDVNHIMARYVKTGHLTHLQSKPGMYADLSKITDLVGAYEDIAQAEEAFKALPSRLRNKFDNDPVKLVEYLQDPKNLEEAIKEQLIPDPKKQEKPETPVETPEAAQPQS